MDLLVAYTGVIITFVRFIEMAKSDMEPHGLIEKIIRNSLEREPGQKHF